MSIYTNAQYIKNSLTDDVYGISVDINGVLWTVPCVPGNADYDNMMLLVSQGELVIEPAD
jgi:hypothetical protein